MFALSLAVTVLITLSTAELFCPHKFDPICQQEMDYFDKSYSNKAALDNFETILFELGGNSDVLAAMAPHIIAGISNQQTDDCDAAKVLNYPLNVNLSDPQNNIDILSQYGVPSLDSMIDLVSDMTLFLPPWMIQKYLDLPQDILIALFNNEFYDENLIKTLTNINDYLVEDFKLIGFSNDIAIRISFNLAACGTIPDPNNNLLTGVSLCASMGYGLAISNEQTKYFIASTGGISFSLYGVGMSGQAPTNLALPFGLSYFVSFAFMKMSNIDGFNSFVEADLGALNAFLQTFAKMIPKKNIHVIYNGIIPGIDCVGVGYDRTAFEDIFALDIDTYTQALTAGIEYTEVFAEGNTFINDRCMFDFDRYFHGDTPIDEECIFNEDCKGHGWGLNDVACCQNKCTSKQNGFCPPVALNGECCSSFDCQSFWDGNGQCCDGKCTKTENDFTGMPWCPSVCKAGLLCPMGSCGTENSLELNEPCDCDEQCTESMGCCNGICRNLVDFDPLKIHPPACPHPCSEVKCPDGTMCCEIEEGTIGKCIQHETDFSGLPWCPSVCKKGILCPFGSCSDNFSLNESCECDEQCDESMKCCDGKCAYKQRDYTGIDWCPSICKKGLLCPFGSCDDNFTQHESCECDEQCFGSMKCCDGKCSEAKTDFVGLDWCANICKKGLLCPFGSCDDNFHQGESCSCDEQCNGWMSCCDGKCAYKQHDYIGIEWCPSICKKGLFCPNGSCSDDFGEGSSCSCDEQCSGSLACCDEKCTYKKQDWTGLYWCPNTCWGCAWCGPGTC